MKAKIKSSKNTAKSKALKRGFSWYNVAVKLTVVFLSVLPIMWFWLSGQYSETAIRIQDSADKLMVSLGVQAEKVEVLRVPALVDADLSDTFPTNKRDELIAALNIDPDHSIMNYDLLAAQTRVESIDWVRKASISRIFPNKIKIEVEERIPFASWYNSQNELMLVDAYGDTFNQQSKTDLSNVFLLASKSDIKHAVPKLYSSLASLKSLPAKIVSAQWVDDRRWNLTLSNGTLVKLPPHALLASLKDLENLFIEQNLSIYPIEIIDYRQTDRVVIKFANRRLGGGIDQTEIALSAPLNESLLPLQGGINFKTSSISKAK